MSTESENNLAKLIELADCVVRDPNVKVSNVLIVVGELNSGAVSVAAEPESKKKKKKELDPEEVAKRAEDHNKLVELINQYCHEALTGHNSTLATISHIADVVKKPKRVILDHIKALTDTHLLEIDTIEFVVREGDPDRVKRVKFINFALLEEAEKSISPEERLYPAEQYEEYLNQLKALITNNNHDTEMKPITA